jgi:hypothetical protein
MNDTSNKGDKSVHGHALAQQTLETLQAWLSADGAPDPELTAGALLIHYVLEIIGERRGGQAVATVLETAREASGLGGEA